MTLLHAMGLEWTLALKVIAAFVLGFGITLFVLYRLAQELQWRIFKWRIDRLRAKWAVEDERKRERRRRDAFGDTLIDELREQYDGLPPRQAAPLRFPHLTRKVQQ